MAEELLRDGDRVVCLGDSITADPEGYVAMARQVIALARPEAGIEVINAGAGGDTAADMLARFEADVLAHEPTWVTISAGCNDALQAVGLPEYAASMTSMIDSALGAGISVGLLTPTCFEPHFMGADANRLNDQIERYAEWLRDTADSRRLLLVPMHNMCVLIHESSDLDDPIWLTHDGAHMSPTGRYLMGLTFLAAFGFALPADGAEAAP